MPEKTIQFLSIVLIIICLPTAMFGQDLIGDLEAFLNEYLDQIPLSDQNDFTQASEEDMLTWQSGLDQIDAGDITEANNIFSEFNYEVISFQDTVKADWQDYIIVQEKSPSIHFWGSYIINTSPCRSGLILQAPHTKHDSNTGKQAIFCFTRLYAKALMLAGTHRCNSLEFSSCDGTTGTCSDDPDNYRLSDLAHNAQTIFQSTTEWLANEDEAANFIQLHGFSKQPTDPFLILSNGSRDLPPVDKMSELAEAFLNIDDSLSSKIAHIDTDWTRLIGFTNVQGRMLNSSLDACDDVGDTNAGRFFHVEQERLRLRADSLGWEKMRKALASVYDCTPVGIASPLPIINIDLFPNPTNGMVSVQAESISIIQLWSSDGRKLLDETYDEIFEIELDLSGYNGLLFFVRIEVAEGVVWRKVVIVE